MGTIPSHHPIGLHGLLTGIALLTLLFTLISILYNNFNIVLYKYTAQWDRLYGHITRVKYTIVGTYHTMYIYSRDQKVKVTLGYTTANNLTNGEIIQLT
jgi:hypothetical protein